MAKNTARGLGRGLASLIPDSALDLEQFPDARPALRMVPIDEIKANPEQPRQVFVPEELAALADSISAHGVMTPLVVRRHEGRYVLIAGERRLRASGLAGLTVFQAFRHKSHHHMRCLQPGVLVLAGNETLFVIYDHQRLQHVPKA